MARIRSAKPDYWTDPLMCSLSRDIRFTFKGLWEVCADDHGRFLADSRVIKGAVWPLDDDISLRKLESWLKVLAERERIVLYEEHGVRYGHIRNWLKHQRVSHASPSRYPDPPGEQSSGNPPETLRRDSVLSGAERNREDIERSGAEEISRAAVREDLADDHVKPRVVLPPEATEFLAMFYEPALTEPQRERYRAVQAQLYDVIDPKHPGPKIRGGTRVKARSITHLVDVIKTVMRDPPNDRDVAIVFVLKKLTDPAKGPSESEKRARADTDLIKLEEQYHAELRGAALRWANDVTNVDEYQRVVRQVDQEFPGDSAFVRNTRDSALTQRCGTMAGFPSFDGWLAARQRGEVANAPP
jgi:hypothetical protein